MSGIQYYIVDTETTGLKAGFHEMTELGIIRATDKVQLWKQIICENPERANYDALKITGKTLADIVKGETKEEVVAAAMRFINQDGLTPAHRCIVGHNIIPFDKKFLHALWESTNQEFPANLWLDTLSLTAEFLKISDPKTLNITKTATGRVSKTLHAACDMVGIKKLSAAHNAKVDSRNNYLLWRDLVDVKKIDYIPHIKTFVHTIATQQSVDELLAELENE